MKKMGAIVLLIVVVAGVISAGLWVRQQLAIDSCLDNGGRWNAKLSVCEMTN